MQLTRVHRPHLHSELRHQETFSKVATGPWVQVHLPTICWMMTLIVRNGMSPHGTLFAERCRQSLGGIVCKNVSRAGRSSIGSMAPFCRSAGMFLASFQTHFRTNSATLASLASAVVPFAGNGLVS
jgi:hypothetical protein